MRRWLSAALVSLLMLAGACSDDGSTFDAFGRSTVALPDGQVLSVLVADTDPLRTRGLSGVTELDGHDGMLFRFLDDTQTRFWMKDTKIALDIAFVTSDGTVLQTLTMPVCATNDDTCPNYGVDQPFRYALEAPAGSFDDWNLTAQANVQIG